MKNNWIEITDDDEMIAHGDICCGQMVSPDSVIKNPMAGSDAVKQHGGWAKAGVRFDNNYWSLPKRRSRLVKIFMGQGCSAKLRFFRLYTPRVLPGNPIYSEPLPLP